MFLVVGCNDDGGSQSEAFVLPGSFRVEIPLDVIKINAADGGRLSDESDSEEPLSGDDIYYEMGTFIELADDASLFLEEVMEELEDLDMAESRSHTYVSDFDNRTKNLTAESNVRFEDKTWEHHITITDAASEDQADGGKGLQMFWNTSPVSGIAIVKPFNLNRSEEPDGTDNTTIARVDYSEEGRQNYDAEMEISVSGVVVQDDDPYAFQSLRVYIGANEEDVDLKGSSNYPETALFDGDEQGISWVFAASVSDAMKIGVVEVGLPPNNLDESGREVLFGQYSVRNVLTRGLQADPNITPEQLTEYLRNTAAPGYFNNEGFVSGGSSPAERWDRLVERMNALELYNPKEVTNLALRFK